MSTTLFTIQHKFLTVEDILLQIRKIDIFPCAVHLYDRVFVLANKDEAWSIATGLEVGWLLREELYEKQDKEKP